MLNLDKLQSSVFGLLEPLGLSSGDTLFVSAAYWPFYQLYRSTPAHFNSVLLQALMYYIGDKGTIVVPCHSLNLCNTDTPFDLARTPSFQRGVFSEYVRNLPGSRRSLHPFASYSAFGRFAECITQDVPRFAYGPFSPEDSLVLLNAKRVGVCVSTTKTTSIHHVEQQASVPYRYMKEFVHPLVKDHKIVNEAFYLYVKYRDMDITSSKNKRLFELIEKKLGVMTSKHGRLYAHTYSCNHFYNLALKQFIKDPFLWAQKEPDLKPYRG